MNDEHDKPVRQKIATAIAALDVAEYGVGIPWEFDAPESVELNRKFVDELRGAQASCMRWMIAKTLHFLHMGNLWDGKPAPAPDPTCYFCSMAYRHWKFWHDVEFYSSTCEGCSKPMYECAQTCGLWEDY